MDVWREAAWAVSEASFAGVIGGAGVEDGARGGCEVYHCDVGSTIRLAFERLVVSVVTGLGGGTSSVNWG